ncbi:MAG: hypothetical protein KBT34_04660 [Prevotella sp.]|nr:hypothetical protein [Candidatus Prevotella equi]
MRQTLLYITLLLSFVIAGNKTFAQNEALDANVHVNFETAGEKEYRTVQYALFKTENKANVVLQELEKAIALQRGDNGAIELDAWTNALTKNKIKFRTSRGNGDFKVHAYPDMAILVSTYLPDDELTIEDARFAVIVLKPQQVEYEHIFKVKMDKGAHSISNVDVMGTNRDTISIQAAPAIDDGKNMYFKIHVELPAGYGNDRGRLVVQPKSVDCQTEDTIDFISGLVMEGPEYHKVQNKQMLFDYLLHDKVAYAYMDKPMYSDEKVYIDTTLVYTKPDRRKSYKIPYTVQIADFNHIYFTRSAATGSCNSKNIFKFLDLGLASADMDPEEFRIDAESNYDTKNQDLRLKFIVGKSELTNDSTNVIQLNDLVKELRSYGDQLMEVNIEATASPEGGLESNRKLAADRTRVAVGKVRQILGKVDIAFHTAPPRVCTWEDVAKELTFDGREDLATLVLQNMGPNGYGGDAAIQQIEGYNEFIEPVLQRLRMMRVTYRYEREHVMGADEVIEAYYNRKQDLLQGRGKDLSDGDYFNLFVHIKDSLELDTITMLAYKHVTKRGGYEQVKFSMYVANRMAVLNQKLGKPDSRVLDPFINKRLRAVTTKEHGDRAQKNRREVLINQIITYFQLEERDSALSFCDYWFGKDDDPKVERLKKYIKFKEGFVKYATHQLTPEQEKEVLDAMEFVISCAPDNKAVLYTEARDILNVPNAVAQKLVSQMADDSPKKWYLRAILEGDLEEKKLAERQPETYIPNYLAFFHHSFELEPSYKWLYFNDGQISDQLRERYKYRKKDIPRYRDMFNSMVVLNGAAKTVNEDEIELSGDDDEQESDAATDDNNPENIDETGN